MTPARRFELDQAATYTTTPGDVTAVTWVDKVAHVRAGGQDRNHTCHWPGCEVQVPPAMWGCKAHWFKLPRVLRDRIWSAYEIGQEVTGDVSAAYLEVAHEVQAWIEEST